MALEGSRYHWAATNSQVISPFALRIQANLVDDG